jgi:hypothetical protein
MATTGLSARTHVRGGNIDETLVRLDGLRLYDPYHFASFQGVFSTVDPRTVSAIDIYSGAFPAMLGDRMSGVIDITSMSPPADRRYEVGMSFFNTSALGAGRFDDGKGEWLASLRRGNLDLLYASLSDHPERPRYVDGFAKISHQVGDRLRITGNVLYLNDNIHLSRDPDRTEEAFANAEDRYVWLRLDHSLGTTLQGSTLVAHAGLAVNRRATTDRPGVGAGNLVDRRRFAIDSVQSDWAWQPNDTVRVETGALLAQARGEYDYRSQVQFALLFDTAGARSRPINQRDLQAAPEGRQYAAYASVRYRPTERLVTDLGLRWDQQTLDPEHTATLSPRLGVRYRVGGSTFLRASLGRFNQSQSIDELQIEDGVDHFSRPEESDQFVVGIEQLLPGRSTLRLEAYQKRMRRLRPRFENLLDPLTLAPELTADRIEVAPSEANARGIEVSFTHDLNAALKWRVTYDRSSVQDRIGAEDVYRSWDQEYALAAGLDWESAKWNVNVQLVQRSGWPTTPVTLNTTAAVPIATVGPHNSERIAAFRSVDVRFERRLQPRRGSAYVFFEASNLFNRANACCTDYRLTGGGVGAALDLARVNYLPLVPSLGFVRAF